MSEQGSRVVDSDRFHDPKPFVDPFDSVALAARLAEARAQRAVVLAKRDQEAPRPRDNPPASQAKIAGAGASAWRAGERALPKARPAEPKVLRADPGMRAVPVRATDPQKPAQSGRALVLAAFLAGCVTVGLATLTLAPWFFPQDVVETPPPSLEVIAGAAPAQVAAPEALAPHKAGPSVAAPDPVPSFAPRSREDRPSDGGGFVTASGGGASATIVTTPTPPGLPRPKPQALTAPSAPPSPALFEPSIETAKLPDRPPQPAGEADRGEEVAVARPPAIIVAVPQARATAPSSPGDAPETGRPTSAEAAARVAVFYPAGADAEAAAALAAIEGLAGPGASTSVGHNIGRTNVRYYHEADTEAARAVAGALNAEARDFTDFRPRPEPGTIEVWLAGKAASAAPPVAAAPRPERAATAPARSAARPEREQRASANAEDQQRLQQQVQRLLREQLRELRRR